VAQLRWTLSQRVYCPATNQLIGIHTGDSTNQALANALWYWPEWRGVESDWPAFKWNEMAGPFVGGLWHCNVYSLTNVLQAYGLWTGAAHSVDYYYKMRALNDWEVYYLYSDYPAGGYAGSPCTWDDQGDSCVHADLARYGQDAEGTYSNAPGIGIGNTNFPGNFVENYVAGWILTTNYGVVKWDVSTNGFKFR
jgi:hypothetical protein